MSVCVYVCMYVWVGWRTYVCVGGEGGGLTSPRQDHLLRKTQVDNYSKGNTLNRKSMDTHISHLSLCILYIQCYDSINLTNTPLHQHTQIHTSPAATTQVGSSLVVPVLSPSPSPLSPLSSPLSPTHIKKSVLVITQLTYRQIYRESTLHYRKEVHVSRYVHAHIPMIGRRHLHLHYLFFGETFKPDLSWFLCVWLCDSRCVSLCVISDIYVSVLTIHVLCVCVCTRAILVVCAGAFREHHNNNNIWSRLNYEI